MKKTLVLSMMLCGSVSLVLAGCAKDDEPGTTNASTATNASAENNGDGDGDPGDGDGDAETGSDDGMETNPNLTFVPVDTDMPSISECDPFAQDCPEGEKCVPYGSTGSNWDANKCVPVTGSGSPGDPCVSGGVVEGTDDCDATSHCWDVMDVDGQPVGVCTEFCTGTPDDPVCAPGTSCLIANEGSITLCIQTCDPLLQDCGAGLACFWANNGFNCIFTTQDIPLGEPCGFINDCVAGTGCLTAEVLPDCNGSACCGSFCSLSDPTCPQEGTECADFFEAGMAPPGYEDVGVCIIPGA
ncbi:ribulose phosphate epimerase [Enhygromyxa salina]|uniref:ribulose phosphate epimerase n=1 Tax=Enhygromyxa salina TaxID=215803 RepID=UPI001F0AEBF4|nr:ribulose phosphate epimerase [Enhygromyxa salina]